MVQHAAITSPVPPANTKRLFDIVYPSNAQIRPALYLALKDTLVADNLDSAVKIAYVGDRAVHRVVTKGGELIDASGSMTGGGKQTRSGLMKIHSSASSSSAASRSAAVGNGGGQVMAMHSEDEMTQGMVDTLEAQLKAFQTELTAVRRDRDECQSKASTLKKQMKVLASDLEKLTVAMNAFEEQEAQYMAQHQQLSAEAGVSRQEQDELAGLAQMIASIDAQMQSVGIRP